MNQAKIIIGADICPTKSNYNLFEAGNREALVGEELSSLLDSADYTIFNLETPLTDSLSPIVKCGPCLSAPTSTVNGLKAINPHFFTLANNHILDQDKQGLRSTVEILKKNRIDFAGVGSNIEEARKPFIAIVNGYKVGIYCCAEHEFSIADENKAGANPYDPLCSFDHVSELRKKTDYVIVLYHGGKEHYRYPSPNLQRVFRKFAEVGADFVVAQHTHCVGCKEEYKGATLVYGQGNFLFDNMDNEFWNAGILIELALGEKIDVNYLPIVKSGNVVRKDSQREGERILDDFYSRSEEIKCAGAVKRIFNEHIADFEDGYYYRISGPFAKFLPIRIFNKLAGRSLIRKLYKGKYLPAIENTIDCECHREFFVQSLRTRS